MARSKKPLQAADPNPQPRLPDTSKKRKSGEGVESALVNKKHKSDATPKDAEQGPSTESAPQSQWNWVARCRPRYDYINEDKDEDEAEEEANCIPCVCVKSYDEISAENPNHIWCMTKEGSGLYDKWCLEMTLRNSEMFDMYFYNDFFGYGVIEIQENILKAFASESKKRDRSTRALWSIMESAAFWLNMDEISVWWNVDDGDRVEELVKLWGTAVVSMVKILIDDDLFKDDSPVKNIALVLGLFIFFIDNWADIVGGHGQPECKWVLAIQKTAEKHGVRLENPCGLEKYLKKFEEESSDLEQEPGSMEFWKAWDFEEKLKKYRKSNGLGGTEHDVSKMSAAERRGASLLSKKKDPFDKKLLPPEGASCCTL